MTFELKVLLIYFLCFGVTSVILYVRIMGVVEKKGMDVDFDIYLSAMFQFAKVISEEKDPKMKMKYNILYWALIGFIILGCVGIMPLVMFVIMSYN